MVLDCTINIYYNNIMKYLLQIIVVIVNITVIVNDMKKT